MIKKVEFCGVVMDYDTETKMFDVTQMFEQADKLKFNRESFERFIKEYVDKK